MELDDEMMALFSPGDKSCTRTHPERVEDLLAYHRKHAALCIRAALKAPGISDAEFMRIATDYGEYDQRYIEERLKEMGIKKGPSGP